MTESVESLLDRRRTSMRMNIAASAAYLFLRDGFEATTVEGIAKRAGISVRTFYRHCDAKEDALTPVVTSGIRDFVRYLAARPRTESAATAIHEAFLDALAPPVLNDDVFPLRERFTLMTTVPGIRARWAVAASDLVHELRPEIAERSGLDPDGFESLLLSHTLIGIMTVALQHWATSDPGTVDLADLVATALSLIRLDAN